MAQLENVVEKLSYDEAKSWFWFRTWLWSAAACAVSIIVCFLVAGRVIEPLGPRVWASVAVGAGVVALALLVAAVSMQLPWMRTGWRSAFALNGPACAVIMVVLMGIICGAARGILIGDPMFPRPRETMEAGYFLMKFAAASSVVWAFVYGSWFAVRMDRYFVEPI